MVHRLFLPLALLGSALALVWPELFVWSKPAISPLLGLIMFGMGVTLTPADFVRVWQHRRLVALGTTAQFVVMPSLAWALGLLLPLPPEARLGLILVGACPGGTASNVITYLARGNVALSVSLTTVSTLLAPVLTPLLVELWAGTKIAVPVVPMVLSVAQLVLAPVLLGLLVRRFFGERLRPVLRVFPAIAMTAIVWIIAIVMGLNRANILEFPLAIILAVVLHNGLGLALGYGFAALAGASTDERRTLAIEVGMQNSGLAVALATQFFGGMTALPGALFSLWHNLSGVTLACWWTRRDR